MAEDTEVLRQVWDGRVPISFSLATDEVCSLDQPEQVFLFVHRMTYFPLVLDRVQRYFSRFIDQLAGHGSAELWLEDENGMPIQWHYPVGVLYDIAMAPSSMTGGPWPIIVHFRGFPEQSLIRCMSREAIESVFMSAIKEADFLKHRGQVVNAMQRKEHKQLFQSLVNEKFDSFWSVNRKLMERLSGETGKPLYPEPGFRNIPFRVHRQDHPYAQTLFQPFSSVSGQANTLGDLIRHALPDICELSSRWRIVIHGTEVPLESHVQWLSEHMSYADNFLHVCVLSTSC